MRVNQLTARAPGSPEKVGVRDGIFGCPGPSSRTPTLSGLPVFSWRPERTGRDPESISVAMRRFGGVDGLQRALEESVAYQAACTDTFESCRQGSAGRRRSLEAWALA